MQITITIRDEVFQRLVASLPAGTTVEQELERYSRRMLMDTENANERRAAIVARKEAVRRRRQELGL
jgi:hypothetical protein